MFSLSRAIVVIAVITAVLYAVSCSSFLWPPSVFPYGFVLALGFPFLFVLHLIATIAVFFTARKRLGILLLVLTFVGFHNIKSTIAFNPDTEFSETKAPTHLRVLNWNVGYWHTLNPNHSLKAIERQKMVELVAAYKPDILCLQEHAQSKKAGRINIVEALKSLGYAYVFYAKEEDRHKSYDGTVIFSKLPFVRTASVETGLGFRKEPLLWVDVLLQGKPVRVATVHFLSFALFSGKTMEGSQAALFKNAYKGKGAIVRKLATIGQLHEQQADTIRHYLDQSPFPVILCGDFNQTPTFYTLQQLKGNYTDAFLSKSWGIGKTFKSPSPFLRIDYCFVDKKLRIVQNKVHKLPVSDHLPVITDISW